MRRFSRLYEQTAEFRARCLAFDFAVVAHAVIDVALATKRTLAKSLQGFLKAFRMPIPTLRKTHQLVLELDGIAQIPMF